MPYNKQAILGILTGPEEYDRTIKEGCQDLAVKWSKSHHGSFDDSPLLFLRSQHVVGRNGYRPNGNNANLAALREVLSKVDDTWRLYICGHGNWKTATCGGIGGRDMAQFLLDGGLRRVKLISVVACRGGYLYSS